MVCDVTRDRMTINVMYYTRIIHIYIAAMTINKQKKRSRMRMFTYYVFFKR